MNIKNIIKSRTINKKKLPDWYQKRVDICDACPYSFKKKKNKTKKNIVYYVLGGFKNTCTICNCPIKHKAAINDEFCSMEAIGEKPLWDIEEK